MADNKKVWQNILIGIVIFFGAINFILTVTDGGNQEEKSTMSKVAGNLEEKYNMAASVKDYFNMCITAGSISDAYFMAKDEINYKKWFETVKKDCAAAGIPYDEVFRSDKVEQDVYIPIIPDTFYLKKGSLGKNGNNIYYETKLIITEKLKSQYPENTGYLIENHEFNCKTAHYSRKNLKVYDKNNKPVNIIQEQIKKEVDLKPADVEYQFNMKICDKT